MRSRIAFLSFWFFAVCLGFGSQSVRLAWDANTETDLAGYRVHWGTASRAYTKSSDVGNVTTSTVSNLAESVTYYFAVTAYNTSGLESEYSNEITFTPSLPFNQLPAVDDYIWSPGQQSSVLNDMPMPCYNWGKRKPSKLPSAWDSPWLVEVPGKKPIHGNKREIITEALSHGVDRIYSRIKKCWIRLDLKTGKTIAGVAQQESSSSTG